MIGHSEARAFAAELRTAEFSGTAAGLPTARFPGLDWIGARRIAVERDQMRRADGDTQIGYKLGWTSAAMREALGIDRPNWGTLWRSQQLEGVLDLTRLRHPKAEPEIVFVAGRDMEGTDVTAHDVLSSAAGWAVGIEVVHPRFESFDFTWLDNTADNSSAGAVAVGPSSAIVGDPSALQIRFSDGIDDRTGLGVDAMGSPASAVAWLIHQLHADGQRLHAGEIVFTGGLTAPFDVHHSSQLCAHSTVLGMVEITTTDSRQDDEPPPE